MIELFQPGTISDCDGEEYCSECDSMVPFTVTSWREAPRPMKCPVCGHMMMMCQLCGSADDYGRYTFYDCDWDEKDGCCFGKIDEKSNGGENHE